ncbi:MAG: hypothetical protein MR283_03255 [Erysipelotrichaceae bacterium]|nr:hypothetical protein [Erysipelotrichaceae bacterium]
MAETVGKLFIKQDEAVNAEEAVKDQVVAEPEIKPVLENEPEPETTKKSNKK